MPSGLKCKLFIKIYILIQKSTIKWWKLQVKEFQFKTIFYLLTRSGVPKIIKKEGRGNVQFFRATPKWGEIKPNLIRPCSPVSLFLLLIPLQLKQFIGSFSSEKSFLWGKVVLTNMGPKDKTKLIPSPPWPGSIKEKDLLLIFLANPITETLKVTNFD